MAAQKRDRAAYQRARYLAKRDELLAERRAWYEANKDQVNERARAWQRANPERARAACVRWREQNPEKYRESRRKWSESNRDKNRESSGRRRAAERAASVDIEVIRDLLASPCAYCGSTENVELDHITPLARGGTHQPENLAPACRSCNRSKGAKLVSEWKGGEVPC